MRQEVYQNNAQYIYAKMKQFKLVDMRVPGSDRRGRSCIHGIRGVSCPSAED